MIEKGKESNEQKLMPQTANLTFQYWSIPNYLFEDLKEKGKQLYLTITLFI